MADAQQVYAEAIPLIENGMNKRAAFREVARRLGINEGAVATNFYRAARTKDDAPVVPRPGRKSPKAATKAATKSAKATPAAKSAAKAPAKPRTTTRSAKAPARGRSTATSSALSQSQIDAMAREIGQEIAGMIAGRIAQVEEENRRLLEEKIERLRASI